MHHAYIVACAAALACVVEVTLFQPLSVRRVVAHAGRKRGKSDSIAPGLPLLLICAICRRPFALGTQTAMVLMGVPYTLAGGLSGFWEGVLFTPTRRMTTMQLASPQELTIRQLARDIYAREGLRGFYRGCWLSGVRTAIGGAVYFATLKAVRTWVPGVSELFYGFCSALVATVVLNPCEVMLTSRFVDARAISGWRDLFRGLWPAVIRNAPGGGFRWWLTQGLVRLIER